MLSPDTSGECDPHAQARIDAPSTAEAAGVAFEIGDQAPAAVNWICVRKQITMQTTARDLCRAALSVRPLAESTYMFMLQSDGRTNVGFAAHRDYVEANVARFLSVRFTPGALRLVLPQL